MDIDLPNAGLVERAAADSHGLEGFRVADAGLRALQHDVQQTRGALGLHDVLVARVAQSIRAIGHMSGTRLPSTALAR